MQVMPNSTHEAHDVGFDRRNAVANLDTCQLLGCSKCAERVDEGRNLISLCH